jgi:hypothetical protein
MVHVQHIDRIDICSQFINYVNFKVVAFLAPMKTLLRRPGFVGFLFAQAQVAFNDNATNSF